MVVVMAADATDTDVQTVVARVQEAGGEAFVSRGPSRTIVGLVGDVDGFHGLNLRTLPGVPRHWPWCAEPQRAIPPLFRREFLMAHPR